MLRAYLCGEDFHNVFTKIRLCLPVEIKKCVYTNDSNIKKTNHKFTVCVNVQSNFLCFNKLYKNQADNFPSAVEIRIYHKLISF